MLYNDHFQNFKRYNIPRAQLVIADIPYNLGNNAYASNPLWYKDGDNKNRWLLQNYAKPNDKIIDTHSGSGSLACACHLEGFEFLAIELDANYHKASCERLEALRSQGRLFV